MPPSPLSFDRAEYDGEAASLFHCAWCGRGLQDTCFRANGSMMICGRCAERAQSAIPDASRRTFWRVFARGAAASVVLALLLMPLCPVLLRSSWGWTALFFVGGGVGYAIGQVMRRAAQGAGGLRYQISATIFIYAAVSVPVVSAIIGRADVPSLATPLLMLTPPMWLFLGRSQEAGLIAVLVVVGGRAMWNMLRAWPLRITGPERLPGAAAGSVQGSEPA